MQAVFMKETLRESVASDVVTLAVVCFCIWFSRHMGGGMWEFLCVCMLIFWLSCRLPFESQRIVKLRSKADAIKWANSLPDDEGAEHDR